MQLTQESILDDIRETESTELSPRMIKRLRKKALGSFYFFAKGILGFPWIVPHVHGKLCRLMEELETTKKLKITLPRGWLKTTIGSIAYPIWRACRDHEITVLLVQNTYTNACSKLKTVDSIFKSCELFRIVFSDILPTSDCTWRGDMMVVNRKSHQAEGTFEAAGTRTTVTSRHYTLIIEDDTVAPELEDMTVEFITPSDEDIKRAIGWHRGATFLLKSPGISQRLVIGTRWAELDLLSWMDQNEKYCTYIRAVREDENGDPCMDGRIIYPERFGEEVLADLETDVGPYMFACLYMNTPLRSGDMKFRSEWFRDYDTPPSGLETYISIDLASDPSVTKTKPDYNVIKVCGKHLRSGRVYVLDYWRERANPGAVIDALFDRVKTYNPADVLLESVAYQSTLEYWIKERMREERIYFHVTLMTHGKSSKEKRIMGLQPLFAAGMIYTRPWMTALKQELVAFPLGANDDLPDALSMQLKVWKLTSHVEELVEDKVPDAFSADAVLAEMYDKHKKSDGFVYESMELVRGSDLVGVV